MTKRQKVIVGGKTFKRLTTAYSWGSAKSVAKQERKHMNSVVVIRKDKDGKTYGVFSRATQEPWRKGMKKGRTVKRDDNSMSWGTTKSIAKFGGVVRATLVVLYSIPSHKMDYTYNHLASFYIKLPSGKIRHFHAYGTKHRTKRAAWQRMRRVQRSFETHMRAGKPLSSWRPAKR